LALWILYVLPIGVAAAFFIAYVIKRSSDRQEERLESNLKSVGSADQATGELVISMPKPSKWSLVFVAVYFVVIALPLVMHVLTGEEASLSTVLDMLMLVGLGFLMAGMHIGWAKFYVSDNGLRVKPLGGRPRSFSWTEIDSVKTSDRVKVFILTSGRKKIVVPMSCEGLHSLSLHIVRHVPPERREQALPYLARSLGNDPLPGGLTL
jgi:hypothetical protein